MTEPSPQRPVPGPPRPGPSPLQPAPPRDADQEPSDQANPAALPSDEDADAFGDLDQRPVAEHVAIFETEHARLQDELSTIDQL